MTRLIIEEVENNINRHGRIIKGFFFDLDGTLVDTHDANTEAYFASFRDVIGEEPEVDLKPLIKSGYSSHDFLKMAHPEITDSQIDAINALKKEKYPEFMERTVANDYLVQFMHKMSPSAKIVLVTTAKKQNAQAVVAHHKIDHLFDVVVYGDDVEFMKPHPAAYELALKLSGLSSDEVIAFEDSDKGSEAARGAGINVVSVKDFI